MSCYVPSVFILLSSDMIYGKHLQKNCILLAYKEKTVTQAFYIFYFHLEPLQIT